MKYVNENYLKKGIKINELLYIECVERLNNFNDISNLLELVKRDVKNSKREDKSDIDFDKYVKNYKEQIEELDRFKMHTKINLSQLKETMEKGDFVKGDLTLEQLEEFENKTRYFIDQVATTLDMLKPIKRDVDKFKNEASLNIDENEMMYFHCRDAQIRIEQIADLISLNSKKGNLHGIIVANSFLKSDIELLKKEKKSR